jgi:hypothetical protein
MSILRMNWARRRDKRTGVPEPVEPLSRENRAKDALLHFLPARLTLGTIDSRLAVRVVTDMPQVQQPWFPSRFGQQ